MKRATVWLSLVVAVCCGLGGLPAVAQRPAPPNLPTVTSVQIRFQTNDDDKDGNTRLSVYFSCNDSVFADADGATFAAMTAGIFKPFSDNSDTNWGEVVLHPHAKVFKTEIHNCTTTVRIDPVGHDTWRFNYLVHLKYSDGTTDDYHFNGHALSQDTRQNTYPLR